MPTAYFRVYADLNDFLPDHRKQVAFRESFSAHETIKHILESLGIPHPEISLILINGRGAKFEERPEDRDRISVYPAFRRLITKNDSRIKPRTPDHPIFVLDSHLGKLAGNLRILGFDAKYQNDFADRELASIAVDENRVLLTRDRGLLKRKEIRWGFIPRDDDPWKQTLSVIRRFDLSEKIKPFSRCARCNGILKTVSKREIKDELEPLTRRYYQKFKRCDSCQQVYWKGSHFRDLDSFVQSMILQGKGR